MYSQFFLKVQILFLTTLRKSDCISTTEDQSNSINRLTSDCILHIVSFDANAHESICSATNKNSPQILTSSTTSKSLHSSKSWNFSNFRLFRYGNSCQMKIFYIPSNSLLDNLLPLILADISSVFNVQEHPRQIAIISESVLEEHARLMKFLRFLRTLRSVPITSKFIVMLGKSKIFAVDFSQPRLKHQLTPLYQNEMSNLPLTLIGVGSSSWTTYSNFHRFKLNVPLMSNYFMAGKFVGSDCNQLGAKFSGNEQFCSITLLSSLLNFTITEHIATVLFPAMKIKADTHLMTGTVFQITERKHKVQGERLEILGNGQKFIPFGFLLVLDRAKLEISDPSLAFDPATWGFLLISILLLAAVVTLHELFGTGEHSPLGLEKVALIFLTMMEIMLEQSPNTFFISSQKTLKTNTYRQSWGVKLLVLAWLYSSIVLCGGYKGVFYSFLTSTTPPVTPQTLLELINSDTYPMVALDSIPFDGQTWVSIYAELINQYMDSISEDYSTLPESSSVLTRTRGYIKAFNKTVLLIKLTYGKIKVAHENQLKIPRRHAIDHDQFVIPREYAAISSTDGIDYFESIMKMSEEHYLVRCRQFDNFISATELFVVTRNFFANPFRLRFTALVESGIFEIWRRYGLKQKLNWDVYMLDCLQKMMDEIGANETSRLWSYSACAPTKGSANELAYRPVLHSAVKAKPISFHLITVVFMVAGSGFILSGVIFTLETLIQALKGCGEVQDFQDDSFGVGYLDKGRKFRKGGQKRRILW